MEMNILEEKKGRLVFELAGADHTLANVIKDELWNDDSVTVATYAIEHPMKSSPRFIVESTDPKKSLQEASTRLQKKNKDTQAMLKKL